MHADISRLRAAQFLARESRVTSRIRCHVVTEARAAHLAHVCFPHMNDAKSYTVVVRFSEIVNRLNGISCPIFGVSWTPPTLDVTIARRLITFLEDRRILYNPCAWEEPIHCVDSVLEIRRFLTSELGNLPPTSELVPNLKALRAACRKFLDTMQMHDDRRIQLPYVGGRFGFESTLGEFRGAIGPFIAIIAVQYGVDVEGELARVLPVADDDQKLVSRDKTRKARAGKKSGKSK